MTGVQTCALPISRKLLLCYYGLRGLSLLFLDPALAASGHHTNAGLLGFLVFYGLDWVATIPPTIALCRECFGVERGAIVFGWVVAGHQLGGALAAWGAGYLRDRTGSYELAYLIAAAGCLIAACGALRIGHGDQTGRRNVVPQLVAPLAS